MPEDDAELVAQSLSGNRGAFEVAAPVGGVVCEARESTVRSSDEMTRVAVRSGACELRSGQGRAAVSAGQVAFTTEGRAPRVAEGADGEPFFAWADAFLGRGSEPLRVPASE